MINSNHVLRRQLSLMAWGATALCAWVLLLAVYGIHNHNQASPYATNTSAPAGQDK